MTDDRNKRRHPVRASTIYVKRIGVRERLRLLLVDPDIDHPRPMTRGECRVVPRPCPYVGCRYNLYADVNEKTGSIKLNFPDLEVDEMKSSGCALDEAERGGLNIEDVGALLNVTRTRVQQIEAAAADKIVRGGFVDARE